MTDGVCVLSSRHRLPDFSGGSVLRALLHRDDAQHGRRQGLPPGAGGHLLLLAVLGGVDCAAAAGLEPVRARRPRHHLLGGLEDADAEQHLLHHLPVHLLPAPAVRRHCVLVRKDAARHQTGAVSVNVNVTRNT